MNEKQMTKHFNLYRQVLKDWRTGRSGHGKVKLYYILSLLEVEDIEEALKRLEDVEMVPKCQN